MRHGWDWMGRILQLEVETSDFWSPDTPLFNSGQII